MFDRFNTTEATIIETPMQLTPEMEICQADYPVDWYQKEFTPYAEEYQALPDRTMATIMPWMKKRIEPALKELGDNLFLLAHYYMGGDIVKMIQEFGGYVGDSYQLAKIVLENPEKKIIVESAVHFMAETVAMLANPDQRVYITNPKSGCTMEMHAKDVMVEPALDALNERYGHESILPVCYMNTSGRIKALAGAQGGAVCTSSNVKKIFQWAIKENKKIFFIPDQHMGENVAAWVGIKPEEIAYWPGGHEAIQYNLEEQDDKTKKHFDDAKLVLFGSHCGVHTYYTPEMVHYVKEQGYHVIVHPECRKVVVDAACGVKDTALGPNHYPDQVTNYGSTAFIWDYVIHDRAGTGKYALGTENHMVENLKQQAAQKNIEVINLGAAKVEDYQGMGCGCATMSRNDPPHLVALLDLLSKGKALDFNEVKPGDMVNEFTGVRQRLDEKGQAWLKENATKALEKMIEITDS